MPSRNVWFIGVGLEVLSTMSGTVGKQLIRFAENIKRSSPRCSAIAFRVGIVVNTVLGPAIDMAAYSFAPQSLIAPFGGLDVVWNALLAPYLLNEKLTRQRILGCSLIMGGTVMAGCFGNHVDPEYTLDYVEETIVSDRVVLYGMGLTAWYLFNRLVLMRNPPGSALRGISLGVTAGSIAGNMFCVKASIELILMSIDKGDAEVWLHWLPYALLAGALFFSLSNLVYLTRGLQEYEALFMVTIYEGSMIVSGCVSGAVVLLDMRDLELWRILLYWCGVLVVIVGMLVIFGFERMSHSSLAAGQASIAEGSCVERTLLEELRERSTYAIPPEAQVAALREVKAPPKVTGCHPPGLSVGCLEPVGCVPAHLMRARSGPASASPSMVCCTGIREVVVRVDEPKPGAETVPLRKPEDAEAVVSFATRLRRKCWGISPL